jgi:hypothetical protein
MLRRMFSNFVAEQPCRIGQIVACERAGST